MSESKTGYAQVTGVLKYNNSTREEMLRRNYWKDEEYTKYGAGIGEYHKIETRLVSPIGEGVSLYDYTQNENSEYGKEINKKYIPSNIEKENYETTPLMQDMRKWEGNYVEIFNDNNKLGEVGDAQYLQLMTFAGYANSDRFLSEKYLTPGLTSFYGSNPQIEGENGYFNVFNRVNGVYKHESGRIAEIAEANVAKIIEFAEINAKDNGGLYYLNQNITFAENEHNEKKYTNETYGISHYTVKQDVTDKKGRNIYDSNGNNIQEEVIKTGLKEYVEQGSDEGESRKGLSIKDGKSIQDKTSELFKKHKEQKIRDFIYFENPTGIEGENYERSHGRNLKKLGANSGDTNPFCRNWYLSHQYEKYGDLIRPFADGSNIEDIQYMNRNFRAMNEEEIDYGGKYLAENTVLNNSGYVNITPSLESKNQKAVEIKKCMFSLENLAWKDVNKNKNYLSTEQQGPNGGRIMWFPPYDLEFQENVQVDWDPNSFIGRGEKVYTYKNTDRTGTLSFTMLIDHPNIVNELKNKEGMEPDYNLEEDVLRFFAGSKRLNLKDKTEENNNDTSQNTQTDASKLVPSEEKSNKIIFYVFFPNNYSGNYAKVTRPQLSRKGYSDEDCFRYILHGKGIFSCIGKEYDWIGYEMTENEGLGESEEKLMPKNYKGCNLWKAGIEETQSESSGYSYVIDFDMHQKLKYPENYTDSNSFQLNSKLEGNTDILVDANYTFAEVMAALYNDSAITSFVEEINTGSTTAITELIELLQSNPDFISAKIIGSATLQGNKKNCNNSELLADRRSMAVEKMLKELLFKEKEVKIERLTAETEELRDDTTVNSKEAKGQRCVKVEIYYNPPTTEKVSESSNEGITGEGSGETDDLIIRLNNGIDSLIEKNEEDEQILNDLMIYESEKELYNDMKLNSVRYETEAEYFEKLHKDSPFVFNSIVDKFKYFSPAFHSISPEGFNARLNFLHQCTRQGHTIEASASNGWAQTAGNLSFGRMPVCVLRIGDFINTRILIQSLSINYDNNGGIQWDLNPEGAGVQPMYAKINLGIVILGGQSLEGPINRLQNAVSFDYYANTGVYDNRADRVSIEDGETNYKYLWTPSSESAK